MKTERPLGTPYTWTNNMEDKVLFNPEEDYLKDLQDDLADIREVLESLCDTIDKVKDKLAEENQWILN